MKGHLLTGKNDKLVLLDTSVEPNRVLTDWLVIDIYDEPEAVELLRKCGYFEEALNLECAMDEANALFRELHPDEGSADDSHDS